MPRNPTVGEHMSSNVFTVNAQESLRSLAEIVQIRKIRHIPVVNDHGRLVGIVTDRDVKRALPSPLSPSASDEYDLIVDNTTVERVMTKEPFTTGQDASLADATRMMAERKIGGLPVVEDKKLIGIFTMSDAIRALLERNG